MVRWALGVLLILAAIAGLVLGVLNPEPVSVDLGFDQLHLSLGALIALSVGLGLMLGLILGPLLLTKRKSIKHTEQSPKSMVIDQDSTLNG